MSVFNNKRELKKAANALTLVKLREVIDSLDSLLADRQKEVELISQLELLAKSQGYTLEQLGYKRDIDATAATQHQYSPNTLKQPSKPKFKSINKQKQYFYIDNGQLHLLRTHTMKKGLQDRGIEIVPLSNVDKKYAKQINKLITEATTQAIANYNKKVDIWNEWAVSNGRETLTKK